MLWAVCGSDWLRPPDHLEGGTASKESQSLGDVLTQMRKKT